MGIAEAWLARKREGRAEMKFTLESKEAAFLAKVLLCPHMLPLAAVRSGVGPLMPYRPATSGKEGLRQGKQIHMLQKNWFLKHVVKEVVEKPGGVNYEFHPTLEVGLGQVYVDLLIQILEHYEPVGLLVDYVDVYVPLMTKLKGDKYNEDDPWEAPESAKKTDL